MFDKNSREQIRISINEYKGTEYIDIRTFFAAGDKFLPSRKGVTLRKDLYPELLNGIVLLGEALGFEVDEADDDEPAESTPFADTTSGG
jgi:hypothetical protein